MQEMARNLLTKMAGNFECFQNFKKIKIFYFNLEYFLILSYSIYIYTIVHKILEYI